VGHIYSVNKTIFIAQKMANDKKSLVEEALIQMKNLEQVVTENAKGILSSTMKGEIEELVKESIEEDMTYEEEMNEMDSPEMEEGVHKMDMEEQEEEELSFDLSDEDDEMEMPGMGMNMDMDSEDMMMGDEDEIEPLDLSNNEVSDEELMAVIMGMGDDDVLSIKRDDNSIDADMMTKTDSMEFPLDGEDEMEMDFSDEEGDEFEDEEMAEGNYEMEEGNYDMEEEIVYEIEMDEEDSGDDEKIDESMTVKPKGVGMGSGPKKVSFKGENVHPGPKGKSSTDAKKFVKGEFKEGQGYDDKEDEKEGMKHGKLSSKDLKSMKSRRNDAHFETREGETKEAARTYGNGSRNYPKREGLPKRKVEPNQALREEVESLRAKNDEYRKALNIFREKLNEVAVFNSNLAYATRLFTEHSTTKQEKINIMRRFDNVETIKESKNLYTQVKEELSGKDSVVKESIVENIDRTPSKGSTNLVESKTYENPQFLRMKDLMSKLK
jgi:hypothetical protein